MQFLNLKKGTFRTQKSRSSFISMEVFAVNHCCLFLLLRFMCTITVTHQGFGFHILLLQWLMLLQHRKQEETQYLQTSRRCFRGSFEWVSRRAFRKTQTVSLCEDFLTSKLMVRLGHSQQERAITNEIALKSRSFLIDSASIIWSTYTVGGIA